MGPESLPLPHDLTGVIFDGTATWFSSRSGVIRWQESELRRWGENEHMDSEVCFGLGKGIDGKIWAATSGGVGRSTAMTGASPVTSGVGWSPMRAP